MDWNDLKSHDIKIYSTPTCGDCRRLKQYLDRQGVPYTEINVDADASALEKLVSGTGHKAIPYVQVNDGRFIKGWDKNHPMRWDARRFLGDVEADLKA